MISSDTRILIRAIEMAESGRHIDVITIETALVAEGYTEAHELLQHERLRSGIRTICQNYWHGGGTEPVNNVIDFKAMAASMFRSRGDESELA